MRSAFPGGRSAFPDGAGSFRKVGCPQISQISQILCAVAFWGWGRGFCPRKIRNARKPMQLFREFCAFGGSETSRGSTRTTQPSLKQLVGRPAALPPCRPAAQRTACGVQLAASAVQCFVLWLAWARFIELGVCVSIPPSFWRPASFTQISSLTPRYLDFALFHF